MVRDFHKVIGRRGAGADSEGRGQIADGDHRVRRRRDRMRLAFSTSSSATRKFKLIGVEAGGRGNKLGEHAARFRGGLPGVLQGRIRMCLQDEAGQIAVDTFGFGRPGLSVDWP